MASNEDRGDRDQAGHNRPAPDGASSVSPARDGAPSIGNDTDVLTPAPKDSLLDHFVRHTDTRFAGKTDKSLIGEDIGWAEDELDEDGEPLKP